MCVSVYIYIYICINTILVALGTSRLYFLLYLLYLDIICDCFSLPKISKEGGQSEIFFFFPQYKTSRMDENL